MKELIGIVALALCLCVHSETTAQPANEADSLVLVELYRATGGENWSSNSGWLHAPVSRWHGITLDSTGGVTWVGLRNNNLRGTIPPALGNLVSLTHLWLPGNNLNGPIPSELGNLGKLESLYLAGNELTGPIPAELGRLDNLENLFLQYNGLIGPIPRELGDMPKLEGLLLSRNSLSGRIPRELENLATLTGLWLAENELSGPIPPELGELLDLRTLDLRGNGFSGPIPRELGNLSRLQRLLLSSNNIAGTIPSELGHATWLRQLDLGDNELSGVIPSELANLPNLEWLALQGNVLDSMPDFKRLAMLDSLDVSYNRMSFEDLEPNAGLVASIETFRYAPQDSIDINWRRASSAVVLSLSTGGRMNEYQWYRAGTAIPGATAATLRIDIGAPGAVYSATVTHPWLPDLLLMSRPISSDTIATAADRLFTRGVTFGLHPVYPNPVIGETLIPFDVATSARVRITVYDLLGRRVQTLVDGHRTPGQYTVSLDATEYAPGIYHYRMEAADFVGVHSLIVRR